MSNGNITITNSQTSDNDNQTKTAQIVGYVYISVSLITFIAWIYCGYKSRSVTMVLVGLFLSSLWPILWLYVLIKKATTKNWKFCAENIIESAKRSVTRSTHR